MRFWKKRKRVGNPDRHRTGIRKGGKVQDYGVYHFSLKEWLLYGAGFLGLDVLLSYLFYESWIAFFLLLPGAVLFFKDRQEGLQKKRQEEMQAEFLTAIQLVSSSLQVGYAAENAFSEALKELKKLYGAEAFIVKEFQRIVSSLRLNDTVEALLMDLGNRSHLEDIRSFAEVFYAAKRTGGDLTAIIQNTASSIAVKQETRREIATVLAGKAMEQQIMSLIPVFILGYIKLTSPGFLDVMYHNAFGILVMSLCLIVYGAAYLWGKKIMDIRY